MRDDVAKLWNDDHDHDNHDDDDHDDNHDNHDKHDHDDNANGSLLPVWNMPSELHVGRVCYGNGYVDGGRVDVFAGPLLTRSTCEPVQLAIQTTPANLAGVVSFLDHGEKIMARPLLTIGMATFRDFHGPYFTVQALRINDRELMDRVEFVIVDNDPDNEHGRELRGFVEGWAGVGNAGARYIPMPEKRGTTQPRQRVFDEASGDFVMVVDSHVLLERDALAKLVAYLESNPTTGDLLQGPILYDDLSTMSTDFVEHWRGEMWGVWNTDPRGIEPTAPPFEIWAQGLGLFCARRESWPGFDPRWRGFGGEEGCIHEVFRQRGDRCLCLPWLRWGHRFAKPGVSNYLVPTWQKVRNYVLGFQRIGRELEPIRAHFVDETRKMTSDQWAALIADPERETEPGVERYADPVPDGAYVARPSTLPQPFDLSSLDAVFDFVKSVPRDLNEHADTLRSLATGADVVVELTKRRESTAFLLAARPRVLMSWQREPDALIDALHHVVKKTNPLPLREFTTHQGDTLEAEVPPCDGLFVDSIHTGPRILAELRKHGDNVGKWLAIRGTASFGDVAENGTEPGLYFGLAEWFEEQAARAVNPRKWVRVYRADNQYGLSVYSCEPDAVDVDRGPGTELAAILRRWGIAAGAGCDCKAKAATMDQWGVAKCRERRGEIVGWIAEGAPRWGWAERIKAVALAVATGDAFQLDPVDPYGSLVDLAINRAAAKEAAFAAKVGAA